MNKNVTEQEILSFQQLLQEKMGKGIVLVTFVKKDGSERVMRCTRNFKLIPKDQRPTDDAEKEKLYDLVKCYDLEMEGWRSFKPSSVLEWTEVA